MTQEERAEARELLNMSPTHRLRQFQDYPLRVSLRIAMDALDGADRRIEELEAANACLQCDLEVALTICVDNDLGIDQFLVKPMKTALRIVKLETENAALRVVRVNAIRRIDALETEVAQLHAERTAALTSVDGVDLYEDHIRANADPDQLRVMLFGAGLTIRELRAEVERLASKVARGEP